ncbi:hypothetical protein EYM_04205 [Ignicoccus islandicus DSM 13165]|uniref:RNA 2',3'-cyclic phosphodiesterase n=1 Tax=Ignicoccus islandicus DSM 13165 TaxID=940295 RepID=A0A0U2U6E5_9CREN|nr:RNA 2',3'-cyclic phosphodiesterase [Ignicoccus islandicus]ALU11732.1 hypothetical protein EYM_04205 [Ignicoccus islandicus DSM 13165]
MGKIRTFIAVDVEGILASKLEKLVESIKSTGAPVKGVEAENFHVTLKFIGEIDEEMIDTIEEIMKHSVNGIEPHKVVLKGIGAFPNPFRPRVVWVGLEGAEKLTTISSRLTKSLREKGIKVDTKQFVPHITLARVKGYRNIDKLSEWIETMRDIEIGELEVKKIRLKKSILTPRGPIYETLREVEL